MSVQIRKSEFNSETKIDFRHSLRSKLLWAFLALSLIPITVVGIVAFANSQTMLRKEVETEFTVSTALQAEALRQWFEERKDDIVTLAATDQVRSMQQTAVAETLQKSFEQWGFYQNLFVLTPDGERVFDTSGTTANLADREYFKQAMQGQVVHSDILISRASGKPIIVFAGPVVSDGEVIGVVGCVVQTSYIAHLLEISQVGETGDAYLVNQAGYLVTSSRFTEELIQAEVVEEHTELELQIDTVGSREGLAGNTGVAQYVDFRGRTVLGAYRFLDAQKWVLIVEQDVDEALAETITLRNVLLGLAVVAVVTVVALALLFSRSIVNPIKMITEGAQRLSRGEAGLTDMDWNTIGKINTRSDELGAIGQAFSALIEYFVEMSTVAQHITEGDLTAKVSPRGTTDLLGNAFAQMVTNLRDLIGQVTANANYVNTASLQLTASSDQSAQATNQVATTIQQVASGTAQQTESVTNATTVVEQVSRSIAGVARGAQEQAVAVGKSADITNSISVVVRQVAANAQAGARSAAEAAQAARDGVGTVEKTIKGMENIKDQVTLSAKKVQEMGRHSDQIGIIVETIDDIASQTNLLALNAAIEAARAGEHGKGFAVVADEVRKLAENATASTKEISGLIKQVQQSIDEAVQAMAEGATEVEAGVVQANEAGHALGSILTAAEAVNRQVVEIASAAQQMDASANELVSAMDGVSAVVEENTASTEEMAAGANEVTQAIENIAAISEENGAAAEEVSAMVEEMSAQVEEVTASAQSLAGMAQELQALVTQFKLPID